jgi:carboxymethylenebutenolidase
VAADTAAAVAHVRTEAGGAAQAVYTVGFCFGGRNSFNQAARGHGLDGGFYGVPQQRGDDDANAPTVLSSEYACKVLGLFGGADTAIPPEAVEAFGAALDSAGVEHDLVTYPDASHSFFDRSFDEHKDACDDAWKRMLRFVGRSI